MDQWEGSQLNRAKEILAYELTNLVHGEEEAKKAEEGMSVLSFAILSIFSILLHPHFFILPRSS